MSITSTTFAIVGDVTRVFATSDLSAPVYFAWYLDGAFLALTSDGFFDFQLGTGDQARVDVLDTNDPSFDGIANAPVGWPARRSLWWVRSSETAVASYLLEQKIGSGSYSTVANVLQTPEAWALGWLSDRLEDLTSYTWRVTPYDLAGNAGTATVIGPELVVRRPDAPNFTVTFNAGPTTVTIASA